MFQRLPVRPLQPAAWPPLRVGNEDRRRRQQRHRIPGGVGTTRAADEAAAGRIDGDDDHPPTPEPHSVSILLEDDGPWSGG